MAVRYVLFVHGYSETSLGAYFDFPRILQTATLPGGALQTSSLTIEEIVLSAFDSLDDNVSVDDLSAALEDHVANLESTRGWDVREMAVICHSTGALIARRWMLDRAQAKSSNVPSHLITLAGAHHGSSLAQVGKSVLGFLQKALLKHILSVGKRVLTDLDYGSAFLLELNSAWVDEVNGGGLSDLYAFSLGGDTPGPDPTMQFLWQTHEPGSDNTVRISAANLNYTIVDARADAEPPSFRIAQPHRPVPHLVLSGYSHYGPETGILGNVHSLTDAPMAAVVQALGVATADEYAAVRADWSARTAAWTAAHPDDANATIVFSLFDRGGRAVDDCFIGILQQSLAANVLDALAAGGSCVLGHSPIHNDVQRASYSFYVNVKNYLATSPHVYHIEAHSGSALIGYRPIDYVVESDSQFAHLVYPNEVTYVRVEMPRDTDGVYALYQWAAGLDLSTIGGWPPFPPQGQIALPPRPSNGP